MDFGSDVAEVPLRTSEFTSVRSEEGEVMAQLTVPIVVDWDSIKDRIINGDVVEVVRCKDCKHYNSQNSYCEGIGNWFCLMNEWSDNGFCYKGERKETEDE